MSEKENTGEAAEAPTVGHNSGDIINQEEFIKLCSDADKEMTEVENERELINEKANKIRAGLREKGINVDAWKAARQHSNLDEDKRQGFDLSYNLSRKAFGASLQADLFQQETK